MAVYVLSADETAAFLSRHPEISADTIPSYGLQVMEGDQHYLVGLDHNTGQIKVINITANANYTAAEISTLIDSAYGAVDPLGYTYVYGPGAPVADQVLNLLPSGAQLQTMVNAAIVIGIGYIIWQIMKESRYARA